MKAFYLSVSLACLMGAGPGRAAAAEDYAPPPFDHYQPILDRMPFGALPADFGQTPVDPNEAKNAAQVVAEQQKLAKQVNMSAVNITPDGQTAIGFTDLNEKPPVNYYLLVGASAGGWVVKSADYDDEIATLEKDGVTITLKLGQGLVDPSTLPAKAPAAATVAAEAAPAPAAQPGAVAAVPHPPAALASLRPRGHGPSLGRSGLTPGLVSAAAPPAPEPDSRSYRDRLLERRTQQTEEQKAAEKRQQEQLLKLAEAAAQAAAQKEIARREEEAAGQYQEAVPESMPQPEGQHEAAPAAPDGNVP